jgi:hypothetical protein
MSKTSEENFDYKLALAAENWLRLHREEKELSNQLQKNREEQALLLKEFPQIGNMKGMFRKEKKKKVEKMETETTTTTTQTSTSSTSVSLPSTPQSDKKTRKRVISEIQEKVSRSEEKRKRRPDQDRNRPREAGGEKFHPTSFTAPPLQKEDKKE